MKVYQSEACQTIANFYGDDSQMYMAIEEMSELTKEICKYKRLPNNYDKIADEIADVKIMLEQLEYIFGVSREVEERVNYKLDRQLRRIEQERE